MVYTVAITKTGQMTLPKALRVFLGVDGAKTVQIEKQKNGIVINKRPSEEEFFAEIDKHISKKTRAIIKKDRERGGLSVQQMVDEYASSDAGKKELEEEYGRNPSPRYA